MKYILSFLVLFSGFSALALEVGDTAVDVKIQQVMPNDTTVDGNLLEATANGQFVLLEFATTWCPTCQSNLPILSTLAGEIKSTAATRLVYVDDNEADIRGQIQEKRELISFPAVLDFKKVVWHSGYSTGAVPTLFVVTPAGKIVFKHVGELDAGILKQIKAIVGGAQ